MSDTSRDNVERVVRLLGEDAPISAGSMKPEVSALLMGLLAEKEYYEEVASLRRAARSAERGDGPDLITKMRDELDAVARRLDSIEYPTRATKDRASELEAERDLLKEGLRASLAYWLSEADTRQLQGSILHLKLISGFDDFINSKGTAR